jgi:transposase-like protein
MSLSRGHGDKLERKREAAVAALVEEGTIERAARKVRVSASTLKRWLRTDREMQRLFRAARHELLDRTLFWLQMGSGNAVATLIKNLTNESASVQLAAANSLLNHLGRITEQVSLEERLAALEAQIKGGT